MGPNTCKLYRSVIIASLTILPVIALATAVASNTSEHKPDHIAYNSRMLNKDERMSDQVRDELKNYYDKKRALQMEARQKVDELSKTLSPDAQKILDGRKKRRQAARNTHVSEHKHVKKNAKNDKDSKESKDQKSEEKKQ